MWARIFKEAPEREFESLGAPPPSEDPDATKMLGSAMGTVERSKYGTAALRPMFLSQYFNVYYSRKYGVRNMLSKRHQLGAFATSRRQICVHAGARQRKMQSSFRHV